MGISLHTNGVLAGSVFALRGWLKKTKSGAHVRAVSLGGRGGHVCAKKGKGRVWGAASSGWFGGPGSQSCRPLSGSSTERLEQSTFLESVEGPILSAGVSRAALLTMHLLYIFQSLLEADVPALNGEAGGPAGAHVRVRADDRSELRGAVSNQQVSR